MSKFYVWIDDPTTQIENEQDFNAEPQRIRGFVKDTKISSKVMNTALRQANLISVALMEALNVSDSISVSSDMLAVKNEINMKLTSFISNLASVKDVKVNDVSVVNGSRTAEIVMNLIAAEGNYSLVQRTGPGGSHGSSNTEYKGASAATGKNAVAFGVLGLSAGDCTFTSGYGAKAYEKGCVAFGTGVAGRTSQEWIDYYWDVENWTNAHYAGNGDVQPVEGDLPEDWENKGIVQKPGTNEYYYVVAKSGSQWVKYAGFFLNPSYAEGQGTKAKGTWSHAQGYFTEALADFSDASGQQTKSYAHHGHVGGYSSTNNSPYGFAHGRRVETSEEVEGQVVLGKFNAKDETAQFIVGIGKDGAPKNGFSVGNDYDNPSIKVGKTQLTETQLKALLALLN